MSDRVAQALAELTSALDDDGYELLTEIVCDVCKRQCEVQPGQTVCDDCQELAKK